jgi:single-stranded-DNA-specific exonuclease
VEGNADIIGFQIGPRINAAGRMDTPLTALRWLLAWEGRTDEFFGELEHLNETRKWTTETQYKRALENVDRTRPILFFDAANLDHGIIGLVAGRLTELYNRPSIVMKNGHDHPLTSRKWDTVAIDETINTDEWKELSIGSCRAPEWCNLIELLDECKHFFVRYGGHRQAAGFTIETNRIPEFREAMYRAISRAHDIANLPKKILNIECILPVSDITVATLEQIDRFRPYGIGNHRPLWIIENVTISNTKPLGQEEKHLSISLAEKPELKLLLWNAADKKPHLGVGNIVSLIVEIDRNEWKGKVSVQVVVRDIVV